MWVGQKSLSGDFTNDSCLPEIILVSDSLGFLYKQKDLHYRLSSAERTEGSATRIQRDQKRSLTTAIYRLEFSGNISTRWYWKLTMLPKHIAATINGKMVEPLSPNTRLKNITAISCPDVRISSLDTAEM